VVETHISPKAAFWLDSVVGELPFWPVKWKYPANLRVIYISTSRTFEIIDEYQVVNHIVFQPNSRSGERNHFFLIEDNLGNLSEVHKDIFNKIINKEALVSHEKNQEIVQEIINTVEYINKNDYGKVSFCRTSISPSTAGTVPGGKWTPENVIGELEKFLSKFGLMENEVNILVNKNPRCETEVLFRFETSEAFMTTYFFLDDWDRLDGTWQLVEETK